MSKSNAPIRVQFAGSGNYYRLTVSVSPLLPREIPQVLATFSIAWAKPEEQERTDLGDAVALTLTADREVLTGERLPEIIRGLTYDVWQRLDRYVKVTVEATYLGTSPDIYYEYGEAQYSAAYGARFER